MIQKILGLILLTPAALAQMDSIRPDVSFTDNNDRFDLTEMVSAQNKMFRDTPLVDDDEDEGVASDADYRRDLQNEGTGILIDAFKAKQPAQAFLTRREEPDFAYDPDNLPSIGRDGDDKMQDLEFQENLNQFKMNIPKSRRRNTPDDRDNARVLLDAFMRKHPPHAFPTRRDDDKFVDGDTFAEDDRTNSFEGGTVSDFEDNLKHFQLNNVKPPSRRKLHDDELAVHEILLQNVVPIVMKVDGYLKPPLLQ